MEDGKVGYDDLALLLVGPDVITCILTLLSTLPTHRLNERLRFLKYGEGQHFKPHCDSRYSSPDKSLKSFLTLHLYLNDSSPTAATAEDPTQDTAERELKKGGATRFWSPGKDQYLDIEPKRGRVLVFQQRMLLHSGEPVEEGVKMTLRSDLMFEWASYEREVGGK